LVAALAGLAVVLEAGRAALAGAVGAAASLKADCFAVGAAREEVAAVGEEAEDGWAVRP